MDGPSDPGLQNERTGLAWQRTLLSGVGCSLLISRLLAEISLTLAIATGLAALTAAAGLAWVGISRFRRNATALRRVRPVGGAAPHLLITVLLVLTAAGAIAYVALVSS